MTSPDGKYIVSGSRDNTVRLWDRESGKEIRTFLGHSGPVKSVAISTDGRYIVSGSEDCSVKIWDIKTERLLATMIGFTDNEWVVYTPYNYYDSSPNGDKYVAFRVGDKVYNFEQYVEIYKKPDIVARVLRGGDWDAKVELTGIAGMVSVGTVQPVSIPDIAELPPPEIVIQYLKSGDAMLEPVDQVVDFPQIALIAKAVERRNGIDTIIVYVNDKIVLEEKDLKQPEHQIKTSIKLQEEQNKIRILATSTKKVKSYPQEIRITYKEEMLKGKSLPELARFYFGKSRSWAVVIGIDDYVKEKGWPPLPYAINDAREVRNLLVTYLGFSADHIIELANAKKGEIERTLGDDLRKKVSKDDRVIIFFSGHGDTRQTKTGSMGYLIPVDGNKEFPHAASISMDQIRTFSELIPAKQILFIIDACYSGIVGTIYKAKPQSETRKQVEIFIKGGGSQLLTAGTHEEKTAMSKKWENHSVFTYYLLKGLKGEADYNKDGVVSVHELQVYLDTTVPQEANQHPQIYHLGSGDGQFIFYREGEL